MTSPKVEEQTYFTDERTTNPTVISLGESLIGYNKTDIMGLYHSLLFLSSKGYLNGKTHVQIAELVELSFESYCAKRNKLEELGLITVGKKWSSIKISFNDIQVTEKWKVVAGQEHQIKYLHKMQAKLLPITPKVKEEIKEKEKQYQQEIFIENKIKEGVKEIEIKKKKAAKAEEKKFPNNDYKLVLDGYRKSKGIGFPPMSPEEMRYRKAIKNMFLSGHTAMEIIDCMQFFNKYHKREGYEWMAVWTIETIGKKISEHKAGKLKLPEIGDDLPD